MGCDIHIVIQRQDADGRWREVPYQRIYRYPGAAPAVDGSTCAPDVFLNRNYDLFAVLANVRNGVGFAGIQMGEGWPSLAAGRGLPPDFAADGILSNPAYPDEPRSLGDHSFTWVGLDELQTFPWDATESWLYGVVAASVYETFKATREAPDSYSGGVSGPGIQVYEPDDYEAAKAAETLCPRPYVRIGWAETAREATYDWPGTVLPWLETLADGRPLRLVLGFDS